MLVETDNMIPVTKLQRQLARKLKEVSETGTPLYILRNNEMAGVLISSEEYRFLKEAEEILEHFEIADMVKRRLKEHNSSKNISWEIIKKKYVA